MTQDKISYKEILEELEKELKKVLVFFEKELRKIRTERASSSLVDDIRVDYFGKNYSLKELATITTGQQRELIIKPWDKSYIEDIVNALSKSDMKATPTVEEEIIRLKLPSLSKEFRKDLSRLVSQTQEQAKQTIRKWRDEAWGRLKDAEQEKKMSEDEKFKGKKKMEEMVRDYVDQIEQKAENKIKEIEN